MIIASTLYKHCVNIKKPSLTPKSLMLAFSPNTFPIQMPWIWIWALDKYGKPLMKEIQQRAKRLREFNTQLNMCIESILLLLKRKEKINLKRWLELESKIIRHHVQFLFWHLACHLIVRYSTKATYKSCCGKTNANLGSAITWREI